MKLLFDDLGNHAGANRTTTFTNCETQTFVHGDRADQLHLHRDVVARHHDFTAFRQFNRTRHVRRADIELP